MTVKELCITLFEDFCFWRENTKHIRQLKKSRPYIKAPKYDKKKEQLFHRMIAWCDERGIPHRRWLYFLFAIRRWTYNVQLEVNILLSDKLIPKFKEFSNYAFFEQRMRFLEESRNVSYLLV